MSSPDRIESPSDEPAPPAVRGLTRRFGERVVLDGVTFTLDRNEAVGLVGENGAGKTTLFRSIAGTLGTTEGSVTVFGVDVTRSPEVAKRRLGYLPEVPALYPEMRAFDYLRFRAELRGAGRTEGKRAAHAAAEQADATSYLERRISELSKGEKQRIALAGALLLDPALLLLDEPTAGLDPHQVGEFRALVDRLARERTVLLSTHVLSEVEATCSRVILLGSGRVVFDGALADLVESERGAPLEVELAEGLSNFETLVFDAGYSLVESRGLRFVLAPREEPSRALDVPELMALLVDKGARVAELSRRRAPLETHVVERVRRLAGAE